MTQDPIIEYHPLEPFLPSGAKVLMLGSFPPKHERWSMEFFYPNFQNDMWRILGYLFFSDKTYFITEQGRHFCRERIVAFCTQQGIALFDTASAVRRLKDNASDQFLEIVTPTDITRLLRQIPHCMALATTGQKATDTLTELLHCTQPAVGRSTVFTFDERILKLYRMPSSSRAYPLSLEKKAESYRLMFTELGLL